MLKIEVHSACLKIERSELGGTWFESLTTFLKLYSIFDWVSGLYFWRKLSDRPGWSGPGPRVRYCSVV